MPKEPGVNHHQSRLHALETKSHTLQADDREQYLERLREMLPELREVEGFPRGEDEDILAISDPPFYTACPNPFVADWINEHGTPYDETSDDYHREPYTADVSEGKNNQIYNAHSYYTKVPHLAIMRYILHYTQPGDIVLDGFAGTGMTGVAAQLCGAPDSEFRSDVEAERRRNGFPPPKWGARRALLNDLAPAATFIAANYNIPVDVGRFEEAAREILDELSAEIGWMYETLHLDGKTKGRINYTVWSEILLCPSCAGDIVFVEEALDEDMRVKDEFPCPRCQVLLTKPQMEKAYETIFDPVLGKTLQGIRREPVLINYSIGSKRFEKKPTTEDLDTIQQIARHSLPDSLPRFEIPYMHMTHERARMESFGITHTHHFFLSRPAQALGRLWEKALDVEDRRLRNRLLFFVEQAIWGMSVLARYAPTHYSQVNQYLSGVYYIGSQIAECSPWYILDASNRGKLSRLIRAFSQMETSAGNVLTSTGTAAVLYGVPDASMDYVFTDPPFGENIYYADLNFLVESWHRVWTDSEPEAIVDKAKGKGLPDYQRLMEDCFREYYRVLKPGRWMTVVFSNSKNSVWNAIQEALQRAGFVVADVRTLDKKQGSFRQVTSTAVKQDMVITTYKPRQAFIRRFEHQAGTESGAWDFVRQHLGSLRPVIETNGRIEIQFERTTDVLYNRMIAFHLMRGAPIPLSKAEFTAGLASRYPERDGMYFLPDQVTEYDRRRLEIAEIEQLPLLVSDENSTILWLRQLLADRPRTYQQIHPEFLKALNQERHEKLPELSEILDQNFLRDDQDRWYVPDPRNQSDLERLRERALLREFETYIEGRGRLRTFRTEAVRAGFKAAWMEGDYQTIVDIAERLPVTVLQEDQLLLPFYDNALARVEG